MPRVKHHRSSRRVPPPKDSDFDHEINLVDHSPSPTSSHEEVSIRASSRGTGSVAPGPSSEALRESAENTDAVGKVGDNGSTEATSGPSVHIEEPVPQVQTDQPSSAHQTARLNAKKPRTPESDIDILYENQRGGFLCGIALFSSKALGNLDPPAWTNYAHKASPTDIRTAQVPDPSWEWAWPDWKINIDDGVDEDGWEYSFMFSRRFSWHKPRWWNSFVRRRAWIRKRVKKDTGSAAQDPNMLNLEYFTVRPSSEMDRSPSRAASNRGSRLSTSTAGDQPPPQIESVDGLLEALRRSRIDREKIEALDSYLEMAKDNLEGLQHVMHEVMSLFVFQASRRVLLTRLTDVYDRAVEEGKKQPENAGLTKRVENLAAAIEHADEEVRRLEYWSDVQGVAAEGESKGAVDEHQGWDPGWQGLDKSGPKAPKPKNADNDGTR